MPDPWLIPLVAACACAMLAILVGWRGPSTPLRKTFVFLAGTLVLWNLFFVVLYSVPDKQLAFRITRFLRVGSFLMVAAIFHLAACVRPRGRTVQSLVIINYGIAVVFAIGNLFDLFVSDLRPLAWGYMTVGTKFYNILSVHLIASFAATIVLLVYDYKSVGDSTIRLQIKFWLLGMLVALPLGLTHLLPVYGIDVYPLGNLGAAAWAGIVAYAIVRHRLMDIDVVVTKGIAYIAGILVILGPAFGAAAGMQRWAFGTVNYAFSAGLVALLLVVGVTFPVLLARTEISVARSLFRKKYESRTQLGRFAQTIVRILDRDRLVKELCGTLVDVFELDRIALFLIDGTQRVIRLELSTGIPPVQSSYAAGHPLTRWLTARGEAVLRSEAIDESRGGAVGVQFGSNGWEVAVPLLSERMLVGFIALGAKKDFQAFGAGELEILNTVGAEASIAFENARLYAELRRSQDIISRASRLSALGTLAAGIAHEIRNPLVSIQTFFQLAPQRFGDQEFMTSFLGLAEAEVQRISHLISELLTFAKSPVVSSREVDLNDIVDRTITLLAPQARTQNVDLLRGCIAGVSRIFADSDQVMQVVLNIVLNAIQATPSGGSVTVETREIESEIGRLCQVEVRDTGPGIPEEMREAIFNPFFTTKDKGTGLGLPIAHRITAECGGFIGVESQVGQGSCFFINMPLSGNGVGLATREGFRDRVGDRAAPDRSD